MDKELQGLSNVTATAEEKIMRFFKTSMPYIVLLISVAFTVIKSLFDFGISNPFSPQFWINLGANILTTLATYSAFCIHGSEEFKETNQPYLSNLRAWGEYSTKIRKECPTDFQDFCQSYARKCVEIKRRRKFEKRSIIPWNVYEAKFSLMKAKELKAAYLRGEITKNDYRAIKSAHRPIKTPIINATSILCGSDCVEMEKITTANRNYVAQSIVLRPFEMLLMSAGLAVITPVFNGVSGADVVFSIVASAFMIIAAAVSGNTAGNNGARREAADVKSKICFLDTFVEQFSKKSLTNAQIFDRM